MIYWYNNEAVGSTTYLLTHGNVVFSNDVHYSLYIPWRTHDALLCQKNNKQTYKIQNKTNNKQITTTKTAHHLSPLSYVSCSLDKIALDNTLYWTLVTKMISLKTNFFLIYFGDHLFNISKCSRVQFWHS